MMLGLVLALALAQGSSSMAGPPRAAVNGGSVADYFSSLLTSNPATECACANLLTTAAEAVTTTRASAAFCTASTGVMTSCGNNLPRVSNSGLLIEGARTNLLLRSQEFDNGTWSTGSTGSGTVPTVTANAAVAPDGTTTAEQIIFPAVAAGSNGSWIEQGVTMTAAAHANSVYLKGASGTGTLYFFGTPDDVTHLTATCSWNSTTWTRCAGTGTTTAATWYWKIGSDGRAAAMSGGLAAQTVDVWQGQVEAGVFASSAIPTAGTAVARAVDSVSLTPSINISNIGCATVVANSPSVASTYILGRGAVIAAYLSTTTGYFYNGTTINAVAGATSLNADVTYRVQWNGTQARIDRNGAAGTPGNQDGSLGAGAIYLGTYNGSLGAINGHLRNIKFGISATGCQP